MDKIELKYLIIAFACVVAASLCFIAASLSGFFLIPGALFLVWYFVILMKYFRCPSCGGGESFANLLHARRHTYHCRHCGEIIFISK